jgi:hypothetical protein
VPFAVGITVFSAVVSLLQVRAAVVLVTGLCAGVGWGGGDTQKFRPTSYLTSAGQLLCDWLPTLRGRLAKSDVRC